MNKLIIPSVFLSGIFSLFIVFDTQFQLAQAHDTNVVSGALTANTNVSIYHPSYAQLKHDVQWDEQYMAILEKNNAPEALIVSHPDWSEIKSHLQKLKDELKAIDNDKQMTSLSHLQGMQKEEQKIHQALFRDGTQEK